MSIKRYNIVALGANVELGKQGSVISNSESTVSLKDSAGELTTIRIANGTLSSHAVTQAQMNFTGKLESVAKTVSYDSGNVDLAFLGANSTVLKVMVEADDVWTNADSNTNITVGSDADVDLLFQDFDRTAQVHEDADYTVPSATNIKAFVTPGAATSGNATVWIWYVGEDGLVDGGGAATTQFTETVSGGSAGTESFDETIDGGGA